ncbi:MAG: DMT family transporter [Chloroflexota bacterium]
MSKRTAAVAALLATVIIWGTTFVGTKVVLRELPPLAIAELRFLLGSLVLVPMAMWEHHRERGALPWSRLALAGLLGGCVFFAFQNVGLAYTSASKASLILGSVPALTALLSVLVLRERLTGLRAAGIAASVVGVVVIVVGGGGSWRGDGLLGDLLVAGSAVAWAVYTVQSKGLEGKASPLVLAAASAGFGALFTLPLALFEATTTPLSLPSPGAWVALGYLGFVASAVPYLLWNYALARVDASEAAVWVNLVPVIAVVSAVFVLGEAVAPAAIVGGAVVLVGVWAASRQGAEGRQAGETVREAR